MAGRITLWGAGELLTSFLGKRTQVPADFYLALIKDIPPTPYVSGSELNEPDAESYARVAIPNDIDHWSNVGQIQIVSTDIMISFVTADEDWGTVRYWAICNANVDGFVYFTGKLADPITVLEGDTLQVEAGDLSVSIGPFYAAEDN